MSAIRSARDALETSFKITETGLLNLLYTERTLTDERFSQLLEKLARLEAMVDGIHNEQKSVKSLVEELKKATGIVP